MGGKLSEAEQLIAGQITRTACALTGVTGDIEAEARRQLLAEQEAEERSKPLRLAQSGGGSGLVAGPNPLNPSRPQPFHPPPGGRGNPPHRSPIIGGLG